MIIEIEEFDQHLIDEISDIVAENYSETQHFKEPMDIQWGYYLENSKSFIAFVMRSEDGLIVGVLFFILANYLHIKSITMAQQVTFYVKPDYRKYALAMIRESEEYFRAIGIDLILQSARSGSGFCKVLERKGYDTTDIIYMKRL